MMQDIAKTSLAMLLAAGLLSGCGFLAGSVVGGAVGHEAAEGDEFDPLEETPVGQPLEDAGEAVSDGYYDARDAVTD